MPAYWRGGTCGCWLRGRGRGATTTVSPTRPHDPNHQHRHHARKSSHDAPSRQAQPPNPTTQLARLRANPHTTTLEPLLQTGINERKRHHASQSSHNARHNQWRANQLGPVCVGMRHPTDPVIDCDIRRNPAHRACQDIRDVRNPIPIDFQSRTSDRLRMPRHTRLDRTPTTSKPPSTHPANHACHGIHNSQEKSAK